MKTDHATFRPATRLVLVVASLLMIPLLAMQVTDQVAWDLADFVVAAALLLGTGILYQLVARRGGDAAYRVGTGLALAAALLLVWANLAVGIIGDEGNRANLLYAGVLAVGVIGSIIARFRPRGMARALFATAMAQVLVAVIALILGLGAPASGPMEIVGANGLFVALFAGSAWLFRRSARERFRAGAGPRG